MDIPQLALKASNRNLSIDDIDHYSKHHCLDHNQVIDALSEYLARSFIAREHTFSFCDIAINEIFDLTNYGANEFTWAIYRAFEEGEGYHPGDSRDVEPSEIYVRPLLQEILADRMKSDSKPN